jgi:hypothetical protein
MKYVCFLFILAIAVSLHSVVSAQPNSATVKAESGTLGMDFRAVDTLGVSCITIKTNTANFYPGANCVNTYQVTFPDEGA